MSRILRFFSPIPTILIVFSCYFAACNPATQVQTVPSKTANAPSHFVKARELAAEQIRQLKEEGVLLVRLKQGTKTVEKLRKTGNGNIADRYVKKRITEHQELAVAMKGYFDFCEYYFFYADDSKLVRQKAFENPIFLNKNLEADSTIQIDAKTIFIGEIGQTSPQNSAGNLNKDKFYEGTSVSVEAFVIMNEDFEQLSKPFPFYARTNTGLVKKKKEGMVKKLNKKLTDFYRRADKRVGNK